MKPDESIAQKNFNNVLQKEIVILGGLVPQE